MPTSGHKTTRDFAALVARRIWTPEDKRRPVANMGLPGANVSEMSRRHGIANSLLYRWRQEALVANCPNPDAPKAFLPVAIARGSLASLAAPDVAAAAVTSAPGSVTKPSTIDIVLANGRSVRASTNVDTAALVRIVTALEAAE